MTYAHLQAHLRGGLALLAVALVLAPTGALAAPLAPTGALAARLAPTGALAARLAPTGALAAPLAPTGTLAARAPEVAALQNVPTSLTQAIATAERQTGGAAYDAGVDVDHGPPRIVVETSGPQGVRTVRIDPQTGHVTATHAGSDPD